MAFPNDPIRSGFGAYANPVYTWGYGYRTIGFYGYFEPRLVKGIDQRLIQLEQGFAAGTDYVRATPLGIGPKIYHFLG